MKQQLVGLLTLATAAVLLASGCGDDSQPAGSCSTNAECLSGQYCGPNNVCTFDCREDTDCTAGTCNSLGKCIAPIDAGVPDISPDTGKPDVGRDAGPPDVGRDHAVPDQAVPDVLSPDVLSPDVLSPDVLSPDTLSPDTCSPNGCGGCTPLASPLGKACGTCGVYACNGPNAVACVEASEMIPLAGYCVDAHEGSVWSSAACTGTQYGISSANFPIGFPANVASKGVLGAAQTVPLFACAIANVTPTRFISWFQAKRACENASKRLCTEAEWVAMCKGPSNSAYPYGNSYQPSWCNTADAASGGVAKTGKFTQCVGGYPGIFDVGGNVAELVTDASGTGCVSARGGTYQNGFEYAQCDPARWTCLGASSAANMGFRCCRTRL